MSNTVVRPDAEPAAPGLSPPLFFVHVPKTAGSTLRKVLAQEYGPALFDLGNAFHGNGGLSEEPVERLLVRRVPREMRLLTGHIPLAARSLLPSDARAFTMLREPVERTLSHVFHIRHHRERLDNTRRPKLAPVVHDDADVLSIVRDRQHFPDNLQTRMLCDSLALTEPCTARMLEEAKRNLEETLAAIGIVERFDESLALFWKRFGWVSPLYGRKRRVTPQRLTRNELTRPQLEELEEINRFDIRLYAHGKALVEKRLAQQDAEFEVEVAAMREAERRVMKAGRTRPVPLGPEPGVEEAVFEARVRGLVADFSAIEMQSRVESLKRRLAASRVELAQARERTRRLDGRLSRLRTERPEE